MKRKITFLHLFLLNHFVMTLVFLGVIGAYGTHVVTIAQREVREKLDPLLAREVDHLKVDVQSIESNVQKLKSIVEMFDYMPPQTRVSNFKRIASETLAPYPIQYNSFVAFGPRLARKYFNQDAFVLTVHRNQAVEGSSKYFEPSSFIAEEFTDSGYQRDPSMQWWNMNVHSPGLNFSDFYFDKGYMEKVMFTSAMGIYRNGELEAVTGIDTLTGEIARHLASFRLGEIGGLLVVDEYGRPVLPLVDKDLSMLGYRYSKPATASQFKAMPHLSSKVFDINVEQIRDFQGVDGETYITLAKPMKLKGRPWYLVVYQKKSEVYADLYGRLFALFLASFIAYLVISTVLFLTGRYIIQREKNAFEELLKSRDAAEAATKSKSIFLSTMSHEIRTPLNAMLGTADLLSETQLNEEQQEYVNSLMSAGESLLHVLNDVLDFSKIEAGKMSLDQKDFLLSECIRETELLVMSSIYRKGLQFHVHYPKEDGWVRGDAMRLKQVLLNLLGNAVKFTEKGRIDLNIHHEDLPGTGMRRIHVEVSDTGIGIAKENQQGIFDEFRQEDSSVTRRFGGTGLGLSISKKIVEMMDGQIFCRSIQYTGSTFGFYVDLPMLVTGPWETRAEEYQVLPSVSKNSSSTDLDTHKILLVDDMDENHVLLKAYLKMSSHVEVESAFSGFECLEKVQLKSYDLILMDVQMPKISGLDTIRKLREIEYRQGLSRIPIVVISANNFTEDREKSLAVGADEHCGKPIRKKTLLELIAKYCGDEPENTSLA